MMSNFGDQNKATVQDNFLVHSLLFVGLWQGQTQTQAGRTLISTFPHSQTSLHHLCCQEKIHVEVACDVVLLL